MTNASPWKTVTIAPFIELINGFAFPSDRFTEEEGMPLIRIRDLNRQETEINFHGRYDNRYLVKRGDLLIGMDGDFLTVKWKGRNALLNQRVCKLVAKDLKQLNQDFLFYRIIDEINHINRITSATTVKHLSSRDVLGIKIDLPPKPEQTKIAEILSTVDRTIEQTEALIAKQQRIKTGLMQDLLTRGIDEYGNLRSEQTHQFKDSPLGRIPVEWNCASVGTHLENIGQGWSPDCEGVSTPQGYWGVLKTTAVVWEGYQTCENKALPMNLRPRPLLEVKAGDVLMTRGGPNSRVGVVAFVGETQSQLMLSDKLYRLDTKDSLVPEYLAMALSSSQTQRHLSTLKTGLAESQTNISQEIVRSLLIRVPPEPEQIEVSKIIRSANDRIDSEVRRIDKLRSLKTALMQDLLTGKKRATALLKKEVSML
jgi:type I restriction enzyme S subunit